MSSEWHELTDLTGERPFRIAEVRMTDSDIEIRGEFELPLLATLRHEDQVFVGEFVRCHGSIKHMEKAFGVSYPTIKSRLNKITEQLKLVEIDTQTDRSDVLDLLESGEITAAEAAERMSQ